MVPPLGLGTRFLSEVLPCVLYLDPREIRAKSETVLIRRVDQHKDFRYRRIPCRDAPDEKYVGRSDRKYSKFSSDCLVLSRWIKQRINY